MAIAINLPSSPHDLYLKSNGQILYKYTVIILKGPPTKSMGTIIYLNKRYGVNADSLTDAEIRGVIGLLDDKLSSNKAAVDELWKQNRALQRQKTWLEEILIKRSRLVKRMWHENSESDP